MSAHLPYFAKERDVREDYTDLLKRVMVETGVVTAAFKFTHRDVDIIRTATGWSVYGQDGMYLSEAIKLVNQKLN